jgi:hypothetical protein
MSSLYLGWTVPNRKEATMARGYNTDDPDPARGYPPERDPEIDPKRDRDTDDDAPGTRRDGGKTPDSSGNPRSV